MTAIIIQGRDGHGAQPAGKLLARAFRSQGLHVQCLGSHGGAQRGVPVQNPPGRLGLSRR